MSDQNAQLKEQIKDLELELEARKADILIYRKELSVANTQLEELIQNISVNIKALTKLQKALVPTEFPHIKGFEFSSKFIPSLASGGDYLDTFEHSDQLKLSLVMSSASGYTMSALLLTSLIDLVSIVENHQENGVENILSDVIKEVLSMCSINDSADLFYGIIDRRKLRLNYCLAPHLRAFHMKKSGDLKALDITIPVLTRDFDLEELKSKSVALSPGDKVIICSRGVIEAQNLDEEIFSENRLVQVLLKMNRGGVHDLRNEILYQVQQFCQGAQPSRDQSVMIFEVKSNVLKLAQ